MTAELFLALVWLTLLCAIFAVLGWLADRLERRPAARKEEG